MHECYDTIVVAIKVNNDPRAKQKKKTKKNKRMNWLHLTKKGVIVTHAQ